MIFLTNPAGQEYDSHIPVTTSYLAIPASRLTMHPDYPVEVRKAFRLALVGVDCWLRYSDQASAYHWLNTI